MGSLYFGDNLDVLREYLPSESVDLIYLDPPFNSQARYNVLFESPIAERMSAQVEAFRDTWTWGEEAERSYSEVMAIAGPTARFVQALRSALGESDMMAYLVMMAVRLAELHRVLKPDGSIYLHCDPTASHYLKVLMDGIFGPDRFVNEIVWKRSDAKGDASGQGAKHFGRVNDTLLFYSKGPNYFFAPQFVEMDEKYIARWYRHKDPDGRRYKMDNMLGPGGAAKGNPYYEVMGVARHWRYSRARMAELVARGRVIQTKPGAVPMYKRYLDETKGVPLTSNWADIRPIHGWANEKLEYPTQKPLALLERILRTSSQKDSVVLDPFCGCGTSVHAAQTMGRQWIGIDVAYYAIRVIRKRLIDSLGYQIPDSHIQGLPRDLEQAYALADRDKYQFQWWANGVVGVQQFRQIKKGADRGIDGEYYFLNGPRPVGRVLTSVKGGKNVSLDMVRAFRTTIEDEKADMGVFICLGQPTKQMVSMAAAAGFAKTAHGQFPKLQIFSIEDHFSGRTPELPPPLQIDESSFSSRKRRPSAPKPDADRPQLMLPFAGGKADRKKGIVRSINPDALTARVSAASVSNEEIAQPSA